MSEEILINVTPRETRVALVENGVLNEVFIERTRRRGLVGNIYKGRVNRVLPGMQAAFVDIGLERAAFLHASDVASLPDDDNASVERRIETISELLREGQELLVQVVKDPLGSKGARLTTHITIPSRYLVFLPDAGNVGVSSKIETETERQRLKQIVQHAIEPQDSGGYIVRTAAEGASAEALQQDRVFLRKLWQSIRERVAAAAPGSMVHEDLTLSLRALRDMASSAIEKVRIDSRESYLRAIEFTQQYIPEITHTLEHYPGERPIFDLYGVEDEIQKALARKVQLKSGGYLIIDQTEALTTIDINTGAFVGSRNLEETIFKTNLEAAQAIARQLRLRNLGGIVILDLIDMDNPEHREAVLAELKKAMARDPTRTTISGFSALGLVEMTRKRTRESLAHILCEPCPTCQGRGQIKTAQTVCYDALREILREARQFDAREYRIVASQSVIDLFLEDESASLAQLGDFIGKPISLQVETSYSQEQYDIVLL